MTRLYRICRRGIDWLLRRPTQVVLGSVTMHPEDHALLLQRFANRKYVEPGGPVYRVIVSPAVPRGVLLVASNDNVQLVRWLAGGQGDGEAT